MPPACCPLTFKGGRGKHCEARMGACPPLWCRMPKAIFQGHVDIRYLKHPHLVCCGVPKLMLLLRVPPMRPGLARHRDPTTWTRRQ
eukprot:363948-Chlamydomonas_euryale.AAC.5